MFVSEGGVVADVAGDPRIQIEGLKFRHGLVGHLSTGGVVVDLAQLFPLGLSQTVEFQQIDLIQIVFLHECDERAGIVHAVVVAVDGGLAQYQPSPPSALLQQPDIFQDPLIAHAGTCLVGLAVHVLHINEGKINVPHHIQEDVAGETGAGLNGGVDAQLFAALQHFQQKVMLGDGVAAAEGDAALAAPVAEIPAEDLQQLLTGVLLDALLQGFVGADPGAGEVRAGAALVPVHPGRLPRRHGNGAGGADADTHITALFPLAGVLGKHEVFAIDPALRVGAPPALEGAAREKYRGAAPGPVVDGEGLNVKNMSGFAHTLIPGRPCSARS